MTVDAGRVIDGRDKVVSPDKTFVTESVAPGMVIAGVLVNPLVGVVKDGAPVAVAITTSGSCTTVAGAKVIVAAGMTILTPRVEMVKAGAVIVRAGAVSVARGAVIVPAPVARRLGTDKVWAGAEMT